MQVSRLKPGDEAAAINAIHRLKPAAERDGQDASPEHMRRLLDDDRNYLYLAAAEGQPVGFLLAYRFPRVDRDRDMVYLVRDRRPARVPAAWDRLRDDPAAEGGLPQR